MPELPPIKDPNYPYVALFVHKDLDLTRNSLMEYLQRPMHILQSEHLQLGSDYIGARIYDLRKEKLVATATKEGPIRLKTYEP